ncbi:hypothetical protein SULI_03050 [Saccharolobus solfataricus]|uniref:Polymerase nucleotidyl transferase domain-containing protein n=3 Tax=Saccharolobus solfataricus TaxID=2287 RepID=Q97V44_SACS2|nr:hypothetical protein [Saccharolobus solfataricus]AAK42901.1 Hypothetical protein SSO2788 [Saccharolobus solfataricus P2]AKA72991.1 hypothetical protein SULB_0597 [Saccharolobus solfataricus]AKA75690.1 hypothetical protein SULC_0595 [Saccharolobus solfataricus]AKA78382.1 hypothetical protein SULA_0595 [Saccharolobus solfataricus]AZF67502.1 hypothetical protein SULG_03050 [Saccharolobus solfataricus]
MEWRFEETFRKAITIIRRFYPDYALIGRYARNFYAPPETTLDIDFLVNVDDIEILAELIDYVRSQGYEIHPDDIGPWQYKIVIKGIRVDLVKPKGIDIDNEMISKRRVVELVNFISFLRRIWLFFMSFPP